MKEDWKKALFSYVQRQNRSELEYSVLPLLPLVRDGSVVKRGSERLKELSRYHRDRRIRIQRKETRASIESMSASGKELRVDLKLQRKIVYMHRNKERTEQRIERERIFLSKSDGRYEVTLIETAAGEREAAAAGQPLHGKDDAAASTARPAASLPYLNYAALERDKPERAPIPYDREAAALYADTHWENASPNFLKFEVDCTNFVSQCLFAGGAPMNYTGTRGSGWWYKGRMNGQELWSYSWAVAHSLQLFLGNGGKSGGLAGTRVESPAELQIGDVIFYDWEGDGRFSHSTFVAALDADGMPLVNAHTVESKHRYWDYRDSYAWTENTQYRFFHIHDFF
ncbi:amidase domain-containing protein [Paenibacillus gansuensis]|uniref:Amidase domain-containing protein n=1 Tax=Paenibacillus gansuensis TaxID=306542 RepID=A0ABW5PIJ9_9BACL